MIAGRRSIGGEVLVMRFTKHPLPGGPLGVHPGILHAALYLGAYPKTLHTEPQCIPEALEGIGSLAKSIFASGGNRWYHVVMGSNRSVIAGVKIETSVAIYVNVYLNI